MTTNDTQTQVDESQETCGAGTAGPWESSLGADPDGTGMMDT